MASTSEKTAKIDELVLKSKAFLEHDDFDSSAFYLEMAFDSGLSKDSFFLMYSDIYLQKGVFDTALAFNYAIKASKESAVYKSKFEQRYLIYSMLDLDADAKKAIDSISNATVTVAMPEKKKSDNLHSPVIKAGIEYSHERCKELSTDDFLSYFEDFSVNENISNDNEGELKCSVKWDLPWPSNRLFTLGTGLRGRQTSEKTAIKKDSVAQTWNVFGQLNDIGPFTFNYTFSRDRDRYYSWTSSNSLNISWVKTNKDYTSFGGVSASGKITVSNSDIYSQLYSIYAYYDHPVFNKISSFYSLYVYYYKSDSYELSRYGRKIFFRGTPTDPVFLTQNLDTIKKPSNLSQRIIYNQKIDSSFSDTTITCKHIPDSYITIAPSLDNAFPLFWKINLKTSLGYSFSFYPDKFKWIQGTIDSFNIAVNVDNNDIYTISKIKSTNPVFPTKYQEKYRIDNTISLGLSLERPVWKIGTFSIGFYSEKTFSSLHDYAPVTIPDWSWNVSTSLSVKYPFRK